MVVGLGDDGSDGSGGSEREEVRWEEEKLELQDSSVRKESQNVSGRVITGGKCVHGKACGASGAV